MDYWAGFQHSFSFGRKYRYAVAIDTFILLVLFFSFTLFGNWAQSESWTVSGGMSQEQIQQLLLSTPDKIEPFITQMLDFLIYFLGGLLLLIVVSLFLFSLSRALVWNKMLGKKFTVHHYWRWNVLHLVLILPLLLYGFSYLLFKLLFNFLVSAITHNQQAFEVAGRIVDAFFLLFLLLFVGILYYYFTEKYRIFESFKLAFIFLKQKIKITGILLSFSFCTLLFLSIIGFSLKILFPLQLAFLNVAQAVLLLLFLSWFRLYLVKTLHEPQSHS